MAERRPFRPKGHPSGGSKPGGHTGRPASGSGPRQRRTGGPGRVRSGTGPKAQGQAGPDRRESEPQRPGGRGDHRKEKEKAPAIRGESAQPERLQKVLAQAGLGSRRGCEELILQGRVSVDGQVVRQLGTRVDPARAQIAVDGEPIAREPTVYYAVNKPKGYVSTNFDPGGRPRVVDLLPEIPERVYTVGRLDEDSTGLMILTNDGELANRLAHPRFGVEKTYRALVAGQPAAESLGRLTEGIWLSDGKVRAQRARMVGRQGQATWLELVLAEGKKREIRRMLSKLGHKVMALSRVAVGPITLKGLPVGECRPLARHEVDLLRQVAAGIPVSAPHLARNQPSPRSRGGAPGPRPRRGAPPRPAGDGSRPGRDSSPPVRDGVHPKGTAAARTRRPPPPQRPASPHGHRTHDGPPAAPSSRRRPPSTTPPGRPSARPPQGAAPGTGLPLPDETRVGPASRPKGPGNGARPPAVRAKRPAAEARRPAPGVKRPAGGTNRPPVPSTGGPPAEGPIRRRIIGLEKPGPGPAPRPQGRKRPIVRKPRRPPSH